jgi:hypothetical protein
MGRHFSWYADHGLGAFPIENEDDKPSHREIDNAKQKSHAIPRLPLKGVSAACGCGNSPCCSGRKPARLSVPAIRYSS